VKVRSSDEITSYNQENLDKERDKLREINSLLIIDYVKSSIEILLNLKLEEQEAELREKQTNASNGGNSGTDGENSDSEPPKDYEIML
jgi:hypothetical protein